LTNTTKKSSKEARTLGEKMASALAEKRAIGSYESVEETVSSTTRIVDQRAKDLTTTPGERMAAALAEKRAIGSDEPAGTRDTTVLMVEDPPDSSFAPPLAPINLVQDQHYSRPGAFRVNPSHIANNGDDDDEESFYGVHNTYDQPVITNQQRDLGELVELEGTLAPENDRAGSRETDGEIGRAKPISEMNFFAQPKVQRGTVVAVLMIGLLVGLTLGLRKGGDDGINSSTTPTVSPLTVAPSTVPSDAPSAAPSGFAIERFQKEILPEYSQVAIQYISSPQNRALSWLANNDTALDSYDNFRRLRRFALATFYYAAGGENWLASNDWLSNENECDWSAPRAGAACIAGRYTIFGLESNNMVGTLPDELSILTDLELLYIIFSAGISGTIPESIGSATSLDRLYLFSNALSGPIPSSVGLLTKLLDLFLDDNILTGTIPEDIGSTTSLEILVLHSNALSGPIPSTVGLLTKLRHLQLYNNILTGTIPEDIGSATSLEILVLHSNALSGPIPSTVGLLTKLGELFVNKNNLTGTIPESIGSATSLEMLNLRSNALSGAIP
jgi:hypothetical protein